ncbi:SDR family NAD(P)-dependent oxidoreductase [Rhodovibrionaceae bacterium A322]
MVHPTSPTSVLITGASSGIGEAMALAYAAPGTRLYLSGRDQARLEEVVSRCTTKGAVASGAVLDVTEHKAMEDWIAAAAADGPLDLVIANAGISAGTGGQGLESAEQTRQVLAVNIDGVVNTALPALEIFRQQGHGHLALMASLAAFRGFPGAAAYCGSKAFVRVWGEGLRGDLKLIGANLTVICPGYVVSRITDANTFTMPMLMSADKAADIIKKGLARNRPRIAFPFPVYFFAWLFGVLPPALIDPLLQRLPKKG